MAHVRWMVAGWLMLWAAGTAAAAEEPTAARIEQAIAELGSDVFNVRQEAQKWLWQHGDQSQPYLRKALKSSDPEVVRRARQVLEKLAWGLRPDTPPELEKLVGQFRFGEWQEKKAAIEKLIAHGEHAYPILLAIITAETDEQVRGFVLTQLGSKLNLAVRQMLLRGEHRVAEQLLELQAKSGRDEALRNYAAFVLMQDRIDAALSKYREEYQAEQSHTSVQMLVYLHRAKGDLDDAAKVAAEAGYGRLLESVLYEQGAWQQLAKRRENSLESESIEQIGFVTAYNRLAGNDEVFEKLIDKIRLWQDDDNSQAWYCAEALLLNNRPHMAIEFMQAHGKPHSAFELLCSQMRFDEAFEFAEGLQDDASIAASLQLKMAEQLHRLGEQDKAHNLLAKAAEAALVKRAISNELIKLVEIERKLGRKQQAFEHAAEAIEFDLEEKYLASVLGKLFPKQSARADVWWHFFRKQHPGEEKEKTLQRLPPVLEIPAENQAEIKALCEQAFGMVDDFVEKTKNEWIREIIGTCEAAKLPAEAIAYAEKWARVTPTIDPKVRLAELHFRHKNWLPAARYYRDVWEDEQENTAALYFYGEALVRGGRAEEGQRQRELARLLTLGDEDQRHALISALDEAGLEEPLIRQRELQLRLADFQSWEWGNACMHLGNTANNREDYIRAADLYQQYMLGVLRTSSAFTRAHSYLVLPHAVYKARARGYLEQKQPAKAAEAAQLAIRYLPGDTKLPLEVIPQFDELGEKQLADELFQRVYAAHKGVVDKFPRAALYHNNLAWLCARCDRRLEEALAHAETAVRLEPSAGHIDTLAECHFRLGHRDKAVETIKRSIELDPDNDFYRRQLKRFAGDSAQPE